MGCPAASRAAATYRPRGPRASPLHRLLDGYFWQFEQVYDERYQKRYGFWRPVIARTVEKFLACGGEQLEEVHVHELGQIRRGFSMASGRVRGMFAPASMSGARWGGAADSEDSLDHRRATSSGRVSDVQLVLRDIGRLG